jgi:hypothetical protein
MDGTIYIANNGRVYYGGRLSEGFSVTKEQSDYAHFYLLRYWFEESDELAVYDLEFNKTGYSVLDVKIADTRKYVEELRGTPYEKKAKEMLDAIERRRAEFLRLVKERRKTFNAARNKRMADCRMARLRNG